MIREMLIGLSVALIIGYSVGAVVFVACWYKYERPRGKSLLDTLKE